MKIISWNINSLKSILKNYNLYNLINNYEPEIFCLCETKLRIENDPLLSILLNNLHNKYYYYYFNNLHNKAYSGTAIFTKIKPKQIIYGLNDIDDEGRVITCEFKDFYLVFVYTPNSGQVLQRLQYRINIWDVAFKSYILKLQEKKKVIICGDLNVAINDIDLARPKNNIHTAGFTIEERTSFIQLINECNLIDGFRYMYPHIIKYSFWSYKFKSRIKNIGWRLDYFLLDKRLIKRLLDCRILTSIHGSDHAPIMLDIIL